MSFSHQVIFARHIFIFLKNCLYLEFLTFLPFWHKVCSLFDSIIVAIDSDLLACLCYNVVKWKIRDGNPASAEFPRPMKPQGLGTTAVGLTKHWQT